MPDLDLDPRHYRVTRGTVRRWWRSRQNFLERHYRALMWWATACGVWVIALPQISIWADLSWIPGIIRLLMLLGPPIALAAIVIFNDR